MVAIWIAGEAYRLYSGGEVGVGPSFLWLGFWMGLLVPGRQLLLAGPVLRVQQTAIAGQLRAEHRPLAEWIPLATAEAKVQGRALHLRWWGGRLHRRSTIHPPPAFRAAVEQALAEARRAPAGTVPQTPAEAAQAVPMLYRADYRWRDTVAVLGGVLFGLLAVFLDRPLLALPLLLVVLFSHRLFAGTTLVLHDGRLWFMGEAGPVHSVEVARIRAAELDGRGRVSLELDDQRYPRLTLIRFREGIDALAQLQKAMEGRPLFSPAPAESGGVPERSQPEGGLRCSLCGRLEPGVPQPGTVHICDRCQKRARREAQDAGHGLQGKEPKPI